MIRLLLGILSFGLILTLSQPAFAQDDQGESDGKKKTIKVKKEKKRGQGSQEDLDALNQDGTESKAYKDYMKKAEKKKKDKDKKNEHTRKKAEKAAEKRRNKAAKKTKHNKKNYGRR